MDIDKLTASIQAHEGTGPIQNGMLLPYKDSLGNETIGYGHLLSRGISYAAANQILADDIRGVLAEAEAQAWWPQVSGNDARARAFCELIFNIGLGRLAGFKQALAAAMRGDWASCANEFRNSLWAKQVGQRAVELTDMIESGSDLVD